MKREKCQNSRERHQWVLAEKRDSEKKKSDLTITKKKKKISQYGDLWAKS